MSRADAPPISRPPCSRRCRLDHHEITKLVHRLGACLDERRFDDMRSLLVEEAMVRTPGGAAEGREAVLAQARRNHPSDEVTQHVITNILIELDGDRADVRANMVVTTAALDRRDALQPAPHPCSRSARSTASRSCA